jgi:hypothetical protein
MKLLGGQTVSAAVPQISNLRNILQGTGFGAFSGLGMSEGDLTDRLFGAATGGAFGAGFSALVGPAVRGLQALGKRVMTKTERSAYNALMRAFERDKISVEEATKRLAKWQAAGAKPEILADLGGDNVRGLLRAAVSVPGKSRALAEKTLAPRQFQQSERVFKDALDALAPGSTPRTAATRLAAIRSQGAELLYDTAYAMPLRGKGAKYNTGHLLGILNRPTMQKAVKEAVRQAKDRGMALPEIIGKDGRITELPDVEMLDWIKKQGLDSIIEGFRDGTTGKINARDPRVRTLMALKDEFLAVVDDLSPAYKSARNAFAGPSEMLTSIERGRAFLKGFRRDPTSSEAALKKMSESEREFFRIGIAQEIQDIVENSPDGADVVKRLFGTPRLREAMRLAMPNEQALAKFEAAIEREATMFQTARTAGFQSGSPTARIAEEIADMTADMGITTGGVLEAVTTGSPRGMIGDVWKKLTNNRKQEFKAEVADAVGQILMAGEPEEIVRLLGILERSQTSAQRGAGAEAILSKGAGVTGGIAAGATTR